MSLAPPDLLQDPLVSEWMKEEGEGGSDVVVGLRTLLSLADPTVAWTIPFENVLKADGTSHLTVIRSPLLPPVLTLRSLAELYFRRLVKSVLHAPSESAMDVSDGKKGEDRSVAYERWQLGPSLKVTVGTERVHLQGDKLDVEDALLEVDVDYTLEFSEGEMEVMPLGQIRRLLYAWLAVSCPVYRAVVDGKTAKLVKVRRSHADSLICGYVDHMSICKKHHEDSPSGAPLLAAAVLTVLLCVLLWCTGGGGAIWCRPPRGGRPGAHAVLPAGHPGGHEEGGTGALPRTHAGGGRQEGGGHL